MLLYIIRHGHPDYTKDILTEEGKQQARSLSKRLASEGINRIYTSPMGRAVETALPLCDLLGLDYSIENWCSESDAWNDFSMPMANGKTHWVFFQQNTLLKNDDTIKRFDDWYEIDSISTTNGKAGMERIKKYSDEFLYRLGYERKGSIYKIVRPNEEKVAVFCHQGFSLAWMSHLLQIPPHIFWASFDMALTGVTIFEFANNEDKLTAPKCLCLSDTSHLYKENM